MIGKDTYARVYMMMTASNVVAVVHSMPAIVDEIRKEADESKQGDEWIGQHPIMRLLVDKLGNFANLYAEDVSDDPRDLIDDYTFVREHAEGIDVKPYRMKAEERGDGEYRP